MGAHVLTQYLENTTPVLCIRYGSVFCHAIPELGRINEGKGKKNSFALHFRYVRNRPNPFIDLEKVLWNGDGLQLGSWTFMVFRKYLLLRTYFKPIILLDQKKRK